MSRSYDVIVIGGGAIGAACARELACGGRRVLVLDPGAGGASGQAWRAAAGMLAPQIEADDDGPLFRLGVLGRDHYTSLAAALREATGIDVGLSRDGIAHVARDAADAAALERRAVWLCRAGQRAEWLGPSEALARWPWLSAEAGALWARDDGALDPAELVEALRQDAERHGATMLADAAVRVDVRGRRIAAVVGERGVYAAEAVVLAAGAWSPGIVERTDAVRYRLPIEPVRGQMAALPWPSAVPPMIAHGYGGYLLHRRGEVIAGSTMEHAGFQSDTTPQGIAAVVAGARAICPAIGDEPRRAWAGLRPITPDRLPIIGPDPEVRGLWYATGHGRNGILLAGITGLMIAELLGVIAAGPELHTVDLTAFTPARFQPRASI